MLDLQVKEVKKNLKANLSKFNDLGFSSFPSADKKIADKIAKNFEFKVDGHILSFYEKYTSISVHWSANNELYTLRGDISLRMSLLLHSMELGINEELDVSSFDFGPVDHGKIRILDTLNNQDSYVLVCPEQDNVHLFLLTYGKHLNKLNLSFEQYIEKAIIYGGIHLWQQFFIDDPTEISDYFYFDDRLLAGLKAYLPESEYEHVLSKIGDQNERFESDWVAKSIEDTAEQLRAAGHKIKSPNKIRNNTTADAVMRAQEAVGAKFPTSFIQFFLNYNDLEIAWSSKGLSGELHFHGLEFAFGGESWYVNRNWNATNYEQLIWFGEEDEQYLVLLKKLRPLQYFDGSSNYVGFIVGSEGELELYYIYNRDGSYVRLPLSFETYISLNIKLLGLDGWLEYYLSGQETMIGDEKLFDSILRLYPDFNFEELDQKR